MNLHFCKNEREMNLSELLIPARHVDLFVRVLEYNGGFLDIDNKNELKLTAEVLGEIFVRLGAVKEVANQKMNSRGLENEFKDSGDGFCIENQELNEVIPKVILDEVRGNNTNLIRAIMDHEKLQLKEFAERYGGKSAAANLSNFLSKDNLELASMRTSTMERLAKALTCNPAWLLILKEDPYFYTKDEN